MGTSGDVNEIQVESMVQDWYDEVKDFNSNNVHQFRYVLINFSFFTIK